MLKRTRAGRRLGPFMAVLVAVGPVVGFIGVTPAGATPSSVCTWNDATGDNFVSDVGNWTVTSGSCGSGVSGQQGSAALAGAELVFPVTTTPAVDDLSSLTIDDLSFTGTINGSPWALTSSGASNVLTLDPTSNSGVGITSGASAAVSIGVDLVLGESQQFSETAGSFAITSKIGDGGNGYALSTSGIVTLAGANSYSGGTTVSGRGIIENASALGSGNVTVSGGGTLEMDDPGTPMTVTNNVTFVASGIFDDLTTDTWAGSVALTGSSLLAFGVPAGKVFTISGPISGGTSSGELNAQGTGTVVLSGTNSYADFLAVTSGTVADGATNAIPTGTAVQTSGTGKLDLAGFSQTVAKLSGTGGTVTSSSGSPVLTVDDPTGTITYTGNLTGSLSLAVNAAGTMELLGTAPTYSGTTTVSSGTLEGPLSSSTVLAVASGASYSSLTRAQQVAALASATGSVTSSAQLLTVGPLTSDDVIGEQLTGSLRLTVEAGSHVATLSATDPFTGTTTVATGTLVVNGATASSATTVDSGATLGGTGTVHSVVAVSGSAIAPGAAGTGEGTLTANLGMNLQSGSQLDVVLSGASSGTFSQLAVTGGTVSLAGALDVSLAGFTPTVGQSFDLLENSTSGITGTFAGLTNQSTFTLGGQTFQISYYGGTSGHDVVITDIAPPGSPTGLTAVPRDGGATVTFTAPSSDGYSPNTGYTITAVDLTNASRGGETAGGGGSPLSVFGLTVGDSYEFTVAATNGAGAGPSSLPSNPVTPTSVAASLTPTSWTASPVMGPNALYEMFGLSCTAPGDCTAATLYQAATETNGVWGSPTGMGIDIYGLSCVSPGNCVAIGNANPNPGIVVEQNGVWGAVTSISVPNDLSAISCADLQDCTAVDFSGDVDTEVLGSWSSQTITRPSDAQGNSFYLASISCIDQGDCTAVGGYSTGAPAGVAMVIDERSGVWQQAQSLSMPADSDGVDGAGLNSVSCTAPGACTAVGSYVSTSGVLGNDPPESAPLVATEQGGVWQQATTIAAPEGGSLDGVSCVDATDCDAVGGFVQDNTWRGGYVVPEIAGTWQTPSAVNKADGTPFDDPIEQVSCVSGRLCTVGSDSGEAAVVGPPVAPANVALTSGVTSATVTWSPSFTSGAEYSVVTSPGGASCSTTATTCTIIGLASGQTYSYAVATSNPDGIGPATTVSGSTIGVPGPATGVAAAAASAQVTVSWTAPSFDGGAPVSYVVTASPGGSNCSTTTLSCVVKGLTNGTAYSFTVVASNIAGPGPRSDGSQPVTPATTPGAPTVGRGVPGNGMATLSWSPSINDGGAAITGYVATASPGGASCSSTDGSCVITGLANGQTYTFTVRATNRVGSGSPSPASAVFRVGLPPPAGNIGISIEGGDFATNSHAVNLDLVWPQGTNAVLVSNDGGFNAAGRTRTVSVAASVPWTLQANRSATVDVYVRFLGAGQDAVTYSDNILFDAGKPTIHSAVQVGSTIPKRVVARGAAKVVASYSIRVVAAESASGISVVDASPTRSGGSLKALVRPGSKGKLRVAATYAFSSRVVPKYVRVESAAGVWSPWVKVASK